MNIMNNNHEKTRHMDAGQLFDEYYDEKNPNLKETTYNIFMSGSMDTEKAFFLVLKKHVELAKSDKNIEESLKVFCNSFNEILTKYLDIQDGKQERIFFAHAV